MASPEEVLSDLATLCGTAIPLNASEIVTVSEGWNKVLAWRDMFSEAFVSRWRILIIQQSNEDQLKEAFTTRVGELPDIFVGLIDTAARTLAPEREIIARESYRSYHPNNHSECQSIREYFGLFSSLGFQAWWWKVGLEVFHWCLETHVPYFEETDREELEKGVFASPFGRFFAIKIAIPAINASIKQQKEYENPIYSTLKNIWLETVSTPEIKSAVGELFYKNLFQYHPELLEYFNNVDMDSLALHLSQALDFVFQSINKIGDYKSQWRTVLEHLGEVHRAALIPTWGYPIIGQQILKIFPYNEKAGFSTKQLETALATLYREIVIIMQNPTSGEEKLIAQAEDWFTVVAKEWDWSPAVFSERMLNVKLEVGKTGTYAHTSEELQYGARVAWRNSAKCIGRISWSTLVVRDRRHVSDASEMFNECLKHLDLATGGTNLLSVMTVFRPMKPLEMWGPRFWNSQFVRFAGYKGEGENGKVLGDPANAEFTEFLIRKKLWTPPEVKSEFDVLPLVLKLPENDQPFVFQLPNEYVHLCKIYHPNYPKVEELGLKWCAVPAITNFNLKLGGIDYACCPFNGWFMELEVTRNLIDRYQISNRFADAVGVDKSIKLWENRVWHEVAVAVLYSFERSKMTIVDQFTAGKSFYTHCQREKEAGRECPGQWSWIGGLVGPNNAVWHHEMRDFYLEPQYHYCCEHWLTTDLPEDSPALAIESPQVIKLAAASHTRPEHKLRVLIMYGSETGNSELVARRVAKELSLLKPKLANLNEYGSDSEKRSHLIDRFTHILVVTSTFGCGDPPSNAFKFLLAPLPALNDKVKYSVLALGSSIYPDFAKYGITVEKAFSESGAKRLLPLHKADDAKGASDSIEEWIKLVTATVLPPSIKSEILSSESNQHRAPPVLSISWSKDPTQTELAQYSWTKTPNSSYCISSCESNEELLSNGDVNSRSTRKITFKLPDGVVYETGDHLAIYPLNSLAVVRRFAELLGVSDQLNNKFTLQLNDNDEILPADVSFPNPGVLGEVLQGFVDFAIKANHSIDFIRLFHLALCNKQDPPPELKEKIERIRNWISAADQMKATNKGEIEKIQNEISEYYPTIIDLLEDFPPEYRASLEDILVLLPRLSPRYYSISSSSITLPHVSITVGVVHNQTKANKWIHGVCSNYLARLSPKQEVLLAVRSSSFRAPKSLSDPVIFVGPGTGLAPMIGFLEDRNHLATSSKEAEAQLGPSHVYFGCRVADDVIYSKELAQWSKNKVISDLHIAYSRQVPGERAYVQDLLKRSGKELFELLNNPRTHFYICGDAAMADGCFEACVAVLSKFAQISRVAAVRHITVMKSQARWQLDVWGIISHFSESRDKIRALKQKAAKVWYNQFVNEEETQ